MTEIEHGRRSHLNRKHGHKLGSDIQRFWLSCGDRRRANTVLLMAALVLCVDPDILSRRPTICDKRPLLK